MFHVEQAERSPSSCYNAGESGRAADCVKHPETPSTSTELLARDLV